MGVGGQHHAPAALPPGNTRYPLYRRLGGPQGRSERVRKISPPTGIRCPDRPASSELLYRLSYPGRSNKEKCLYIPFDQRMILWQASSWTARTEARPSGHPHPCITASEEMGRRSLTQSVCYTAVWDSLTVPQVTRHYIASKRWDDNEINKMWKESAVANFRCYSVETSGHLVYGLGSNLAPAVY